MPIVLDTPALPMGVSSVGELHGTWIVAEAKPQYQKRVASELFERGIGFYLPLVKNRKYRRVTEVPLFSRYVFACFNDEREQHAVKDARGVYNTIDVRDQFRFACELRGVEQICPHAPQLLTKWAMPGVRARVTEGPLMGQEGIIVQADCGKRYFTVQISMLGQSIGVEIPPEQLEQAA